MPRLGPSARSDIAENKSAPYWFHDLKLQHRACCASSSLESAGTDMAVALNPRFMTDPHEIRVDEESKLTLHGLLQYFAT